MCEPVLSAQRDVDCGMGRVVADPCYRPELREI